MESTGGVPVIEARTRYQRFFIVFLSYFLTGIGAQYIFYSLHTGPTILWPPAGIAVGFLVIWGYEQWAPIAAAQVIMTLVSVSHPNPALLLIPAFAYTAQAIFAAYALKKFRFEGSFAHARDAVLLVVIAIVVSAVAPTILTWTSFLVRPHQISFWTSWSRVWVGNIVGMLVITPFITAWLATRQRDIRGGPLKEAILAMAALTISTYLLFWKTLAGDYSFVMIYIFLGVFFWIGFRFRPRVMTIALLFAAMFGIAGSMALHGSATTLNAQLFADELFFLLIVPIFLIMAVTVTERRLAIVGLENETRELAAAMEKLSEQDRSKNEFISIFAHELRNPLAPIASTLEYLKLNERDPENLEAVEMADQQVRIVRRLLDDLLDVARINQKKFNLQKEMVTLESILRPAIAAVQPFFKTRGHSFWYSLPGDEIFLEVDTARMTQAIMNILFNAGKYTPPGGAIELIAKQEGTTVSITVKDNGVGISSDMFPVIFEPFRQVSREAEVGTGLGLGLFIAKQLIEMHGGTITVVSEGMNKGTAFTIRLSVALHAPTVGRLDPFAFAFAPPGRMFSILIVDDNQAAAEALQKLLALRGHVVRVAYTAAAAIEKIEKYSPEVVLLDIGLPDMNGYDLAREIKRRGTQLSLIALTGYGQEADRIEAERAGFDHHLTKPIGLADIEIVLASLF